MGPADRFVSLSAAVILSTFAFASLQKGASLRPVTWTSKLNLKSLSQIDERLNRPLEDPIAVFKDRETARVFNCRSCLDHVQRGFTAAGDRELRRLKSVTADCRALQLLKSAKPS